MPRRKNFLVSGSPLIEEAEIAEVAASLPLSSRLSDDVADVAATVQGILN